MVVTADGRFYACSHPGQQKARCRVLPMAAGFYSSRTGNADFAKPLKNLVIPTGIEPVTYRLGICRSILLSYGTTRPDT